MALIYEPSTPPSRPFSVGDRVEVIDRTHQVISTQTVAKVLKRRVRTSCGREWTPDGEWFDGRLTYPFPSIRIAAADDDKGA